MIRQLMHEMLDAIAADPTNDASRLVYADALSAAGDPRGEFISLQCRLAAEPDDSARRKLKILENKLLKQYGEVWLEPLTHALRARNRHGRECDVTKVECDFERGFVHRLKVPAAALTNTAGIFKAAPLLREVQVGYNTFKGQGHDDFEWPIRLDGRFDASEWLGITSLSVRIEGLGDPAAIAISKARSLSNLEALELAVSRWDRNGVVSALTDEGVDALAQSRVLTRLKRLELSNNRLTAKGLEKLSTCGWPLVELGLGNNLLAPGPTSEILTQFKQLQSLDIAWCAFEKGDLSRLAASKNLSTLQSISFEHCQLGVDALREFFAKLTWQKLSTLNLAHNGLGDSGVVELAKFEGLRCLTSLQLGHNRLGKKSVKALAESPHLKNLKRLMLTDTWARGSDDVVEWLTTSPTLKNCSIYLSGRLLKRAEPEKRSK